MRRALLVFVLACAPACSHVDIDFAPFRATATPVTRRAVQAVELFTSAGPARKYLELGTLKASHDAVASDGDLYEAMKREAAERGCDALWLTWRDSVTVVATCLAYVVE